MKTRKNTFQTAVQLAALVILTAGNSCTNTLDKAAATITGEELREYTMTLASDSFMGRKPFTEGERITTGYLSHALADIGFEPLFGESWFQEVPMVEITPAITNAPAITFHGKEEVRLTAPDEIAIWSERQEEHISLEKTAMVFCGFGIVAPEYGWNDYADIDIKGKCAVVLVNDPGLYSGDSSLFKGKEMTYYGRWTYKLEEAARQGAAAVLIIHETLGAGYDYSVPRKGSITPGLYMVRDEHSPTPVAISGWLNAVTAGQIFAKIGLKTDSLRKASTVRGHRSFEMNTSFSVEITNRLSYNSSHNVAGILKGSVRPEECIVYSGHWDHFGVGEKENGDSIYNGAVDNATTIAWALETGEAFASLKKRPERSVILFFPTAEEDGLLGSYFFTSHPPVRLENIIACFNNDMMLAEGRMKDIMVTGYGQSELEDMLSDAVSRQGRYVIPDPRPETGMYFRSDHLPFARAGIPSLFARGNCESLEYGRQWAVEKEKEYLKERYHKPADNYYPEMNFEGIAEDARAVFEIGYVIVNSDVRPAWKEGSEFAPAQ